MSHLDWKGILNWSDENIEDLRATAFFYIREGHYEKAKPYCEALVILNPTYTHDLHTLGALYLQKNEPQMALDYLNRAYDLEPENHLIQINRIKALLSVDQKQEARFLLTQFVSQCKDKKLLQDAEALLMSYTI